MLSLFFVTLPSFATYNLLRKLFSINAKEEKMAIFTNQATLSYRNTTVNSNVVSGEIVETLSITKNALLPTYDFGGDVVYVINITNIGNTAFQSLTLTDDLGAYEYGTQTLVPLTYTEGSVGYYVDGVLQPALTVADTSPLTLTGISVPAGGVATLIYRASVNGFAPLGDGGEIVNTATVSGGGLAEAVSGSETVSALLAPRLDITKAIDPVTVGVNGEITYTFTVYNYGGVATVAADDVIIRDVFEPILTDLTATYNGTAWVAGTDYTYNQGTGEFASVAGAITVPAASYNRDPVSGEWNVLPGQVVISVSGTVS